MMSISLGYKVDREKWDTTHQLCLPRSFHGVDKVPGSLINEEINRYRRIIGDTFTRLEVVSSSAPTIDKVRKALSSQFGVTDEGIPVSKAMLEYIIEQNSIGAWKSITHKQFRTLMHLLLEFRPDIRVTDFNSETVTDWIVWLWEKKKHRNSTVQKQMVRVRQFLRWCEAKGYAEGVDWNALKPKLKETQKLPLFLTWEELQRLYTLKLTPEQALHGQVRDIFCFCSFTSLRYSDVMHLTWADIQGDTIHAVQVKTGAAVVIDLNKYSSAILEKYALEIYDKNHIFPRIPNQVMNRYLKHLGKWADLGGLVKKSYFIGAKRVEETYVKWQLLGTHTARRTFICNALSMGISPQVVMKWTGHSDYDAMRPYIDVTNQAQKEAMKRFDDVLNADDFMDINDIL